MRQQAVMADSNGFSRLHLALVGKEKSGKSRLAVTARKPVWVADFDNRRESIAGIPGVYATTYLDAAYPIQPDAIAQLTDDIGIIEKEGTLDQLGFKGVMESPKTVVLDSSQSIANSLRKFILYTNKAVRREFTFGRMTIQAIGNRDYWNQEMAAFHDLIMRVLGLPTDVILIMHEAAEESPDSTDENPRFTGRVSPFPVRYARELVYFNEVWRIERNSAMPTVQIMPDSRFTAATNLILDRAERPDISFLLAQHEQKLNQLVKPIQK